MVPSRTRIDEDERCGVHPRSSAADAVVVTRPAKMLPTERLYFADPYLTAFQARVVARAERGGRPAVALDRSAFYPEGGGQPHDVGTIDGVDVVDVQVDDDGVVWHTLAAPSEALAEDASAEGRVDWARRLDHMQQHHGQHLLSAAFEQLFGLHTVSFHLGPESATIDLAGREVSDVQLADAEALTNRVIWENRPVHARFVTPEELATIPLRKAPTVEGAIRVVSVPDFDHSACGGTHPGATGAVGVLHVRRRERRGEDTRVEFVAGGRALRDLARKHDILQRVAASLTVGLDEVEEKVRRLRESEDAARRAIADAATRLAAYEAAERLAAAPALASGARVVRLVLDDRTMDDARALARAIAERGGIAVLGVRAAKPQLLFARGPDAGVDVGALLRATATEFGGRGGGQPAMAQGGIADASRLEEAVAWAERQIAGG
jgi:alanyl-tRNA synthetase